MDPVDLIARHYKRNSKAHGILLSHSEKVADKAQKKLKKKLIKKFKF